MSLMNESQIAQKASQGDYEAYKDLINHYLPRLSRMIVTFTGGSIQDPEDILQEIFADIFSKKDKLAKIDSLDAYVLKAARNRLLNWQESEQRRIHRQQVFAADQPVIDESLNSGLSDRDQELLDKAVEALSDKLKAVYVLHHRVELSVKVIAEQLDLPFKTVEKRLTMAKKEIEKYLVKHRAWLVLLFLLQHF